MAWADYEKRTGETMMRDSNEMNDQDARGNAGGIQYEIAVQVELLEVSFKELAVLEDKIQFVMTSPPPREEEGFGGDTVAREMGDSPLVVQIQQNNAQLRSLRESISSLAHRVQL